eukprot:GHRR01014088.1.p2 GENE.GHRR01014088.1~~GHRR01014088.1.p2  ORF type:complete len:147 (+),score=31.17 GHRR01014088.1:676-1116(+)
MLVVESAAVPTLVLVNLHTAGVLPPAASQPSLCWRQAPCGYIAGISAGFNAALQAGGSNSCPQLLVCTQHTGGGMSFAAQAYVVLGSSVTVQMLGLPLHLYVNHTLLGPCMPIVSSGLIAVATISYGSHRMAPDFHRMWTSCHVYS